MPTPSIQKSKRTTRLDTKKEKEKREREEKEFEEWKQSLTYYDRACLESRRWNSNVAINNYILGFYTY